MVAYAAGLPPTPRGPSRSQSHSTPSGTWEVAGLGAERQVQLLSTELMVAYSTITGPLSVIATSASALTERDQRPGTGYAADADSADELKKKGTEEDRVDEVRPDSADEFRRRIEGDLGGRVDEVRPEAGASRLAEAVEAGLSTSEIHDVAAVVLQCAIRVRAAAHRWHSMHAYIQAPQSQPSALHHKP
jgi:hypothetical protein